MENIDRSTGEITEPATEIVEQPADEQGPAFDAAVFASRDLLEALILEIKLQERPWDAMTQAMQDEVIERLRNRVETNVRKTVGLIVSDDKVVMPATVESVTFKEGVKAVLKISRHAVGRHDLADCEGSDVVVVIVDPKIYMRSTHEIKGRPDQQTISVEDAAAGAIERAQGKDGDGGIAPTDNPRGEG